MVSLSNLISLPFFYFPSQVIEYIIFATFQNSSKIDLQQEFTFFFFFSFFSLKPGKLKIKPQEIWTKICKAIRVVLPKAMMLPRFKVLFLFGQGTIKVVIYRILSVLLPAYASGPWAYSWVRLSLPVAEMYTSAAANQTILRQLYGPCSERSLLCQPPFQGFLHTTSPPVLR